MSEPAIDATAAPAASSRLPRLLPPVLIAALAVLPFLPALTADFLDWDDNVLFTENPHYRGLGPSQLRWMFTHAPLGHYQPITWITLGLDYLLWGMEPTGYHITNTLFHAANAVLLYLLTSSILSNTAGVPTHSSPCANRMAAGLTALFFAVHPLRVESVAWITERRDGVSTCFLLACVLAYWRHATTPAGRRGLYLASLSLFGLSMLAKPWGMTLPLVLLLIDAYPLRRWTAGRKVRLMVEKLPFALVSAAVAALAHYAQSRTGMASLEAHGFTARFAQAAYGLLFYPWKTIWPVGLTPLYQLPLAFNPFEARFVTAYGLLVIAVILVVRVARRSPAVPVAAGAYALLVSPVLGIAQTGPQLVADRYSYVACIPFAVLFGAVARSLPKPMTRGPTRLVTIGSSAWLMLLAGLTWRQCRFWRSSEALWTRAVLVEPNSPVANDHLGGQLAFRGDLPGAERHFRKALELDPGHPGTLVNLAAVVARIGSANEARDLLRRAVQRDSSSINTLWAAAQARSYLGDDHDAVELYERLLGLDPARADAHCAMGVALLKLGRRPEAVTSLTRCIELLEKAGSASRDPATYRSACSKLAEHYASHGDAAAARQYRQKARNAGLDTVH